MTPLPGARRAVVGQLYTALNNADHTAQVPETPETLNPEP
jgi:hypothetical protein